MFNFFKKFRFGLRFLTAFLQKHRWLILTSAIIGIFFFVYLPKVSRLFFSKKVNRIGLVGKYTLQELPLKIQAQISDGLTFVSPTGEVEPGLAESWEVKNKGKEYHFTLRQDLFWHSGKPILASDINYNFNDVASSPIDDRKIKFELKEAYAPFPAVVARPIFQKGLIGSGRYKVVRLKKNGQTIESLTLKHVEDPSQPKLVFKFYPTESAARTGFKLGEVDLLREIGDSRDLASWSSVKTSSEIKFNRFVGVFFNTQPQSQFENKSLRQALAYGINKRWEPRALSSFNPHSWAYNPNVKSYDFDPERAKELLKKAGEDEEGLALEEVEIATIPSLLSTADEIKADWEKLGLKVKTRVISNLDEPFGVLLITQEIPLDPDQYFLWHSTQGTNLSGYKSPKLDKLLEDGRKTFDQEKRKEIYQDFQRFLVEETPAVFLFHPTAYTLSKKGAS